MTHEHSATLGMTDHDNAGHGDDALDSEDLRDGALSAAERAAVEAAVAAVVAHDERLEWMNRDVCPDPYWATRDWGDLSEVHLVMPPGPSTDWEGSVYRTSEEPTWASVSVQMWTAEHGLSDLELTLQLTIDPSGPVRAVAEILNIP
jgi:hypothetical protein